ncbi:glycerate kinase [Paenibacillus anseongense]|uniref:glycerate kinase n=1 Tax=Paenibacillus anseongense TaxID=2682845 RepID=UPI002DB56A55|nr:glycerate kinase [Paenibacillus anseongense]MEC0270361.1 glycerate kinase [Paenibacillus anseongense]
MKIIIAPDSFKGSMSAATAALAIDKGFRRYMPNVQTVLIPVADGGEGTIDCLIAGIGGVYNPAIVTGPLGNRIEAHYGAMKSGSVAVIEMACASGICLLSQDQRNPLITTTYGTGELISKALDAGYREFILAIGGSATLDGGAGMLQALGMRLLDETGEDVSWGGGSLDKIVTIDDRGWDPRIAESQFLIASDVQIPLIGSEGAVHVFGPQKGATPVMINQLERNMTLWADLIEAHTGMHLHDKPGAGAAGGLGGAFLAFFPAKLQRGIDVVIEYSSLRQHLIDSDLVITGEGRIDNQTVSGKTPMGIAQEAQKFNVPTIAFAGSVGKGIEQLYDVGIHSVHSIMTGPMTLEEAMKQAPELLEQASEQLIRTLSIKVSSFLF